jgi:alpha,alpha-trehalase
MTPLLRFRHSGSSAAVIANKRRFAVTVGGLFTGVLCLTGAVVGQESHRGVPVEVKMTLEALIRDEDTDNDTRITIDDPHIPGTARGDKRFWIKALDGQSYEVAGTYYLSNLLQELKLAEETGRDTTVLDLKKVFEPPADRISRMIREYFWDGLTRRVDERGLPKIIADEKTTTVDGNRYVYVPRQDRPGYAYFSEYAKRHPELKVKVVQLPDRITGEYLRSINGHHGLLVLALKRSPEGDYTGVPFVVPGGRFNEMYGWDSYFITLGLLNDERVELAKAMVDNFVYEITRYGKILNANRTYYLTRSQPPFFTSMVRAVYKHLPKSDSTKLWLHTALEAAIDEYTNVWMNKDHLTQSGLSRYFDTGYGPPPEVEKGHFDALYAPFAQKSGLDVRAFERAYVSGTITAPDLDALFVHDRAMRESGHDTSYRLLGVCADLATVDLNSLLYKIERDIGDMIAEDFKDAFTTREGRTYTSLEWYASADRRKAILNKLTWNTQRGMFFDYDVVRGKQRSYVSATTFYPLWAGLATNEQAASLVHSALPLLEAAGGIVASDEESRGPISPERPERQWDYPNGWAPHQILVWQGLLNYGYDAIVHRLVYRWLYTITSNAVNYNGTIPEKFNLVSRSHRVFAEYGNVGSTFSYITREGFGWTNASYELGISILPQQLRDSLNRLIPPEWVFREK